MRAPKARAKYFAKKKYQITDFGKKSIKKYESKKKYKKSIKVSKKYNLADFQKKSMILLKKYHVATLPMTYFYNPRQSENIGVEKNCKV